MIKKLSSSLLFSFLLITGCSNDSSNINEKSNVFENQQTIPFSLTLPANFHIEEKSIHPENKEDFPVIYFDYSKDIEGQALNSFLEKEKEFQTAQCMDKQACPQVSAGKNLSVNGYEALNYVVQYPSRNPQEEGEHMNNYHYSFKYNGYFIHFWMYASDLNHPQEAEKKLTDIINTISFKPKTNTEVESEAIEVIKSDLFEDEGFSFEGFGPFYVINGKEITVSKDEQKIVIHYGASQEEVTPENLLDKEKEWNVIKCGETDGCGEFITSKTLNLNDEGYKGIKFTLQYKGRSLEDPEGFINEYHYSILNPDGDKNHLYQFFISSTDLENPEEKEKLFDEFMKTISFGSFGEKEGSDS